MKYRLTLIAREDILEIVRFYEGRQRGLGQRFATELETVCSFLCENPLVGRPLSPRTRRHLMKSFPHLLIYRVASRHLVILRVVHQKRDPEGWKESL